MTSDFNQHALYTASKEGWALAREEDENFI